MIIIIIIFRIALLRTNGLFKKHQQTTKAPGKALGSRGWHSIYTILLAATIGCISAGNHRQTNCEVMKDKVCSNYFNENFCSHFSTSTRDLLMEDTISEFSHYLRLLNLDNYTVHICCTLFSASITIPYVR